MPPITNAKKVCSTILSGSNNVLPTPQTTPERPEPTVAEYLPYGLGFDAFWIVAVPSPPRCTHSGQRDDQPEKDPPSSLLRVRGEHERDQSGVDHIDR